eukprot:gnl/TRDRNA2_/TRDRNA2_133219_c0_seq2.p1 gnl/TRDRNA2_/TRDRNA2_133219_c0~~gnl/TRDRNA2_/TRDRNA2_133219_c0_seq2.p1  ORF type:complete len:230 (-),score=51.82 gnl/TRDRNA2_/TRDRNA2_133219_c0_seq2:134-823(-)
MGEMAHVCPKPLEELQDDQLFHEGQTGRQCGLHVVNNLLQRRAFTRADFNEISLELHRRQQMLQSSCGCCSRVKPLCRAARVAILGTEYDVQVIEVALKREGADLQWFDRRRPLEELALGDDELIGLIVNRQDKKGIFCGLTHISERHWLVVRRTPDGKGFVNLDSRLKKAKFFEDEKAVLAWLGDTALLDARSCVFRVTYAKAPNNREEATAAGGAGAVEQDAEKADR